MIKVAVCPACNNQDLTNVDTKIIIDHAVSQESFSLSTCPQCQLIITNPQPDVLDKYYASENYVSHNTKTFNPINVVYKVVRNYMLNFKFKRLSKYLINKKVLDYGCGNGSFLSKLIENNIEAVGFEPNPTAIKNAQSLAKNFIHQDLNQLNSTFDAITMWHVLEHIPDLQQFKIWINKKINKNGYLIIAVPNHKSEDQNIYQNQWAAYDVPRHLWHFSQDSIRKLFSEHFTLTDQFPLIFDAYFVSLLSEKYRKNKIPWIKAFLNGYKSNKQAKKTNEYSSIVYVFKRKN